MIMCSVLISYCVCRRPSWKPKTQPNGSSAVVWLSFWFSTRFTRKTLDHSRGTYLYLKKDICPTCRHFSARERNGKWPLNLLDNLSILEFSCQNSASSRYWIIWIFIKCYLKCVPILDFRSHWNFFLFFRKFIAFVYPRTQCAYFFSIVLRQNITIRIPVKTQNFYEIKVYSKQTLNCVLHLFIILLA